MVDEYVKISIEQGPINVPSLSGTGERNEVKLWDDIIAHEYFPPTKGSGTYQLNLKKLAHHAEEVPAIEAQLKSTLFDLSQVWHFAGGTFLYTESARIDKKATFTSNAEDFEKRLLTLQGKKRVSKSITLSAVIEGTYKCMPLKIAVKLCRAAKSNMPLSKMLKYYYDGMRDKDKWFVHIYKVREALSTELNGPSDACQKLGILKKDWSDFGRILNTNDLRHADTNNPNSFIPHTEVEKVKQLARVWLAGYLKYLGLPVVQ